MFDGGGIMGISVYKFGLILIGMGAVALLETFWIRMMLDNRRENEGYSRYSWTIILACTNFIGAFIYLLTVRRKRMSEKGE